MCGISVVFDPAARPGLWPRVQRMHASIPHRGPDGEGFLALARDGAAAHAHDALPAIAWQPMLGMAFRRLAICDPGAAAAQPMRSADGRCWLAFNGEVYNFRELRRELEALGHAFRSRGDAEVVLAAYVQWGEACFARFEGMWAIVIADLRQRRLVLSRDRFGIKPLYWQLRDGMLALASETKQLADAPRANAALVAMFLHGRRYPCTEETFFEEIRAVPPASVATLSLDAPPGAPAFRRYWRLEDFTAQPIDYAEALQRAEAALSGAVASHRVADVKVGALLSGGLDSSTLVALARAQGATAMPTFSLGYRQAAPEACELHFVDAMAHRDGIENHEAGFDAAWIADSTDRVLWALEEPPLAMPAFAQFRVFELCRAHGATVILDGQGADEIVAGYPYHQQAFVKDRLRRHRYAEAWRELHAIGRREGTGAARVLANYFVLPRLRRRPAPLPWVRPAPARIDAAEFAQAAADRGRDESLVNRQLHFDVRWGNVKIVLGYGDRNAMAHSIECRVPYFDRAFVELAFSLPDTCKIGRGDRKRVLRDIARRHAVPREITERADRMGFGTPDDAMLRAPLRGWVDAALADAAPWIDLPAARRFVADFHAGRHDDHRALWRMAVLGRWARRFGVAG